MTAGRVLIHVQHLLGVGHLRRAELLARGLAAAGHEVHLASGGLPAGRADAGGATFHQLPPMRARDLDFAELVDAAGAPVDDAFRAARRAALLDLFAAVRPQAVITETFPFGRRMLRFELEPLVEAVAAARPRPVLVASVRDILQARSPQRTAESLDLFRRRYDAVLVHADPAFARLEDSLPGAEGLGGRVRYTGYMVADPAWTPPARRSGEVVVSAGGGAVGRALLDAALGARPRTGLADAPWRLLAGANLAADDFAALAARAGPGVTVERARPDFRELLAAAEVSVSQAGYNTVMDILQARTRAVLVPFAGHGETEQPTRARLMAARGRAEVVAERDLDAAALAAAVDRAAARPRPPAAPVAMDGIRRSAAIVGALIGDGR